MHFDTLSKATAPVKLPISQLSPSTVRYPPHPTPTPPVPALRHGRERVGEGGGGTER